MRSLARILAMFMLLGCWARSAVAENATVKVTRDALCPGEISPLQYGQFIEYLCNLVGGMWAEKLYDGGFEGLTPYKMAYLRETDFCEQPWYPSGAVNRGEYSRATENHASGETSQLISVADGTAATVGISQDGICVERSQGCALGVWLRQERVAGVVRIRLHEEGKLLAACEFKPTDEWKSFSARLVPTETSTRATLSIEFSGPGKLWIDNASLMPAANEGGWRPDVVEATRGLRPGVIRFGGSAVDDLNLGDFKWLDTIGPVAERRTLRAWGGLQPSGAGLEEIVQFCYAVGAEPLICVRVNGNTPDFAANEVLYFNMRDCPARVANGHREPYGIKYWQVGNELSGVEYESKLPKFCQAMKRADPSIKLLASYPTPGVLKQAGEWLDYVCPHHYDCANLAAAAADIGAIRKMIAENAPGRPIRVAVTEWNTTAGDWGPRRARLWTLENALACARYQNLLHRHADIVEIANRSNLTNSFCSGIIQTDRHRLYKTPTFYAQQLYATLAGNRPLKIESSAAADAAPDAVPDAVPDISATLSADGRAVILLAVNPGLASVKQTLDLSAFGKSGQELSIHTLADRDKARQPDVTNSFTDPERIAPVASKLRVEGPRFDYEFPPLSLTVIEWRVPP